MPDEARGGIGGGTRARVDADSVGQDPGDQDDMVERSAAPPMNTTLNTTLNGAAPPSPGQRETIERLEASLHEAREEIRQGRGQFAQLEADVRSHREAILQDRAKVEALGRALAMNYRVEAARIAASCRQPAEQASKTIDLAREIHRFLTEPDQPLGEAQSAAVVPMTSRKDMN